MVKFLGAGEKAEISNFIDLFWLKYKLLEQNIDIAVSSADTERLWKVLAKSELWFLIHSTRKWSSFLEQARRSKFQISLVCFIQKKKMSTLTSPKSSLKNAIKAGFFSTVILNHLTLVLIWVEGRGL